MLNIDDLLLVPFERLPCWPYCRAVAQRAGLTLPAFESWVADLSDRDRAIRDKAPQFQQLARPEAFCIVVFAGRSGLVRHVGIVLEDCRSFTHTTAKTGPAVLPLDHPLWGRKIFGFYRYVAAREN